MYCADYPAAPIGTVRHSFFLLNCSVLVTKEMLLRLKEKRALLAFSDPSPLGQFMLRYAFRFLLELLLSESFPPVG